VRYPKSKTTESSGVNVNKFETHNDLEVPWSVIVFLDPKVQRSRSHASKISICLFPQWRCSLLTFTRWCDHNMLPTMRPCSRYTLPRPFMSQNRYAHIHVPHADNVAWSVSAHLTVTQTPPNLMVSSMGSCATLPPNFVNISRQTNKLTPVKT